MSDVATAHAHLKAATAPQHRALEQVLALDDHPWSPESYAATLLLFLPIYAYLEGALLAHAAALAAWRIDVAARRKVAWLVADLRALGQNVTEWPPPPRFARCARLRTVEQAWGCLYVLEGATLGGQFLARRAREMAPLTHATRFFDSYGRQVGPQWQALCYALNAALPSSAQWQAAADGAAAVFNLFLREAQAQAPRGVAPQLTA